MLENMDLPWKDLLCVAPVALCVYPTVKVSFVMCGDNYLFSSGLNFFSVTQANSVLTYFVTVNTIKVCFISIV